MLAHWFRLAIGVVGVFLWLSLWPGDNNPANYFLGLICITLATTYQAMALIRIRAAIADLKMKGWELSRSDIWFGFWATRIRDIEKVPPKDHIGVLPQFKNSGSEYDQIQACIKTLRKHKKSRS